MVDVLLINPNYSKAVYRDTGVPHIRPPLGLAYLASYIRENGFGVEIIDANGEGLSEDEVVQRVERAQPLLVGITSVSATMPLVSRISERIKKIDKDLPIVVGGPHVTFTSEETLENHRTIDICVRGEGEQTLLELISAFKKGENIDSIRGITFRKNGKIQINPKREIMANINDLPIPAYDLLPLDHYTIARLFKKGFLNRGYMGIITSRGCPEKCSFCSSSRFWERVRFFSPVKIIEEVEYLVKNYHIKHLDFWDDTLTLPKKRIKEICLRLKEASFKIMWSCNSRVPDIDEDLVDLMKQAGCVGIELGIESGNQDILNRIRKRITLEQAEKAVRIIKNAGIKVVGNFMIGLPGDTEETVRQTIEFAKKLSPDFALFFVTTPYPGTDVYHEVLEKGLLPPGYIWDRMSTHFETCYRTDELSAERLAELYRIAYKEYYWRWPFVIQSLWRLLQNLDEIPSYTYLFKDFILSFK